MFWTGISVRNPSICPPVVLHTHIHTHKRFKLLKDRQVALFEQKNLNILENLHNNCILFSTELKALACTTY